jgi:hypothetical protein
MPQTQASTLLNDEHPDYYRSNDDVPREKGRNLIGEELIEYQAEGEAIRNEKGQ